MRVIYILFFIALTLCGCKKIESNKKIDNNYFLHFTTWNSDEGLEQFKKLFDDKDIIVLGETHNSRQTSLFVTESVDRWKQLGFNQFIVETGAYSANKLESLFSGNNSDNYLDFLKIYSLPYEDAHPIPFFEGKEDIEFLSELIQNNFDIHGIDQEFVYAYPYLWDDLFKIEGSPNKVKGTLFTLQEFARKAYEKDENTWDYNIYKDFMNHKTVLEFYDKLGELSEGGQSLKIAIQKSLEIYDANRTRSYSHLKRVYYLRENLDSILKHNIDKDDKIILKIGRIHAGKTRQLNAYDVGHYLQSYAKANKKKAIHIGFIRGQYKLKGELIDYSNTFNDYYFNNHAKEDSWTLINLKKYKALLQQGNVILPASFTQQLILSDIENFDYLIIPPLDERQNKLIEINKTQTKV